MTDYEQRQRELRIKYGSNKTKQNYYSSRMGGALAASGQQQIVKNALLTGKNISTNKGRNVVRNSSQSAVGSLTCGDGGALQRQKSSSSVTSAPGSGQFVGRLMVGTASSNMRKQDSGKPKTQMGATAGQNMKLYSRQMSMLRNQIGGLGSGQQSQGASQRAPSVTSASSQNQRMTRHNSIMQNQLQNSEAKSLVRIALKNQKRGEKIAGSGYQSNGLSHREQEGSANSQAHRFQNRTSVQSGFGQMRMGGGAIRPDSVNRNPMTSVDFRNQNKRTASISSNVSNGRRTASQGGQALRYSNIKTAKTGVTKKHERDPSASSVHSHNSNFMLNGFKNQNQEGSLKSEAEHQKLVESYAMFNKRLQEMQEGGPI